MKLAIAEAKTGVENGHGGPFGAVVVKDGQVIASGHNCVLKNKDSTCHGEMEAIRSAEAKLGTYDLAGCELYTTAEPCPMCLAAIMWANIGKVYYGCTLNDNARIGFRDVAFDMAIDDRTSLKNHLLIEQDRDECLKLFKEYDNLEGKVVY